MTTPYERRCLTLLRAYPPRYRAARGNELLGTLLDVATPGRETPSIRESWDVVRGGLRTRWRAHPPVGRWLLYRGFGARLPYAYRWWARDDILGRWFAVRNGLGFLLLGGPVLVAGETGGAVLVHIVDGVPIRSNLPVLGSGLWWTVATIVLMSVILTMDKRRRALKLKKHEFHPDGTPFEAAPTWGRPWPPHVRQGPVATSAYPPVPPHAPASWPPLVPPVAARARRPEQPRDDSLWPSGPWQPPK
ncbi:hypothetical protein OG417_03980 [Actinoallomurus sp. NBC_01490]|uniref:hypothetical protein n=1 Tax=Actinoallomurus sp. NBC_01490 TaxID=2903557 RepID=UPI002E305D75|nr:hypothetical protein [Actinoallomurus sp. NBC_01490]